MVFLLFCHVVVTLFTFRTCQCDFYAHDFHLHCVFALSLVILTDQRRPLRFCPAFAARTSAISGIKKRPSSMSLIYHSIRAASCQQNSPKYAENFYQSFSLLFWVFCLFFSKVQRRCSKRVRKEWFCPEFSCPQNHSLILFSVFFTHPIWNTHFSSGC